MSALVLAAALGCATVATLPCDRGADCADEGLCIADVCRSGSARATVALLDTVAVAEPVLTGETPALKARAEAMTRALEAALDWTGFYAVLPRSKHPRVPRRERMSESTRAIWRSFAVTRVMRLSLSPGSDLGSVEAHLDIVDTAQGKTLRLGKAPELILPGGDRRIVARWINGLVGYDTGLPATLGSRLLVSVEVALGQKEIAAVESDGSGLTFVTRNGSINVAPAWGPKGSVGYMSYRRRTSDWIVNGRPFSTREGLNAAGAWSPDGTLLALCVSEGANSEIVLLDALTGAEVERLTRHPAVDTSPAWSPDGQRLAFVSDRTGTPQIWTHDLRTGAREKLSDGGYAADPAWSPLGDSVVYTQLVAGQSILVRRDLDTGRFHRLTEPELNAESPTLSPDGRWIVFVRRTADRGSQLWRLPLRGGDARPLAQQAWPLYAPDWQRR